MRSGKISLNGPLAGTAFQHRSMFGEFYGFRQDAMGSLMHFETSSRVADVATEPGRFHLARRLLHPISRVLPAKEGLEVSVEQVEVVSLGRYGQHAADYAYILRHQETRQEANHHLNFLTVRINTVEFVHLSCFGQRTSIQKEIW